MDKRPTQWYVKEVTSCGKTFYQARRIITVSGDPMAARTEKRGGYYEHRRDAEELVQKLNEEEKKK